jgi:diguanylate cyclase (GGDEF)-like protein
MHQCASIDPQIYLKIIGLQTEIAKLGLDLAGVINAVVNSLPSLTNAAGALVEYAHGEDMVCRGASGIGSVLLGYRAKRDHSLSGHCVDQGGVLTCGDTELDSRVDIEPCRKAGIRSIIAAPLSHDGINVGTLKIIASEPEAFSQEDAFIVELMSGLVAAAMYHAAKNETSELYVQATHDALTGLANRALFFDRARHRLSQGRRHCQQIGMLLIDMDQLKSINDKWGHRMGDAAIKETAKRIRRVPRETDLIARLGGDEFGVMLESIKDRTSINEIAHRISSEIGQPFIADGHHIPLSASVGVSCFPADGTDVEALIEKADQAMYSIKNDRSPASPSID